MKVMLEQPSIRKSKLFEHDLWTVQGLRLTFVEVLMRRFTQPVKMAGFPTVFETKIETESWIGKMFCACQASNEFWYQQYDTNAVGECAKFCRFATSERFWKNKAWLVRPQCVAQMLGRAWHGSRHWVDRAGVGQHIPRLTLHVIIVILVLMSDSDVAFGTLSLSSLPNVLKSK